MEHLASRAALSYFPPTHTDVALNSGTVNLNAGMPNPAYRTDRVYATTNQRLALAFAAYWSTKALRRPGGTLYQVSFDDDEVETDADSPRRDHFSYQAPSGYVIAVARAGVIWSAKYRDIMRSNWLP